VLGKTSKERIQNPSKRFAKRIRYSGREHKNLFAIATAKGQQKEHDFGLNLDSKEVALCLEWHWIYFSLLIVS